MTVQVVGVSSGIYKVRYDGKIFNAVIKGKILKNTCKSDTAPLVAGDFAEAEREGNRFLITSRLERSVWFERYNFIKGRNQVIASNFDVFCPVISHSRPEMNRYFVHTVLSGLSSRIDVCFVFSKSDLSFSDADEETVEELGRAGFKTLKVSSFSGEGTDELKKIIKERTALFAGESGCGKSSLLNALCGRNIQVVGNLSDKNLKGSHTTTSSMLYFERDFSIIDTPGVRYVMSSSDVDCGIVFPEFSNFPCLFSDCRHIFEKGCGVMQAVREGEIARNRYDAYVKLCSSAQVLIPKKYGKESSQI